MINLEMTIPKSPREIVLTCFFRLTVVVSVFLAVLNLANNHATNLSIIWLFLVAWILWSECRDTGSVRRYLIDWLAAFAGRKFVLVLPEDLYQARIRFGYELFGRYFYQKDINFERIKSVEWSPGQATSMAGRDMKDWSVALWYAHGDSEKNQKYQVPGKPDQNVYIIGPTGAKENTANLGVEFVSFLNSVGVPLIECKSGNAYFRKVARTKNIQR